MSFHRLSFHRLFKTFLAAAVVAGASISAGPAFGLDRDVAYVRALESHGFGDVAVNYLESLDKNNAVSPALREVFDLEMSKSLRAEAQNPPDPAQRGALLARSQKYLDQFVKNNPNHPEALQAQVSSAEMMFDHAQETIGDAKAIKDKTERIAVLTQARGELAQVKSILQPAVEQLIARLKKLGPRPTVIFERHPALKNPKDFTRKEKEQEAKRQEMEFDMIRTSGELALVDYFTAQTLTEPTDDAKRKVALSSALKSLDTYYQMHRSDDPITQLGRSGFIGALVAHTWSGKAAEELGDPKMAEAIYEEVLESFPDPPDPKNKRDEKTGLETILARAKYYSLQLIANDPKRQKEFLQQAQDFINDYKRTFRGEWGYQATEFELVKRLVASTEKEADAKKKAETIKQAIVMLKDMASVRSEFQIDATKMLQGLASGANPTSVDEALVLIRIAITNKNWEQAEALCRTALDMLSKKTRKEPKDVELAGQIQDTLAQCQIQPIFKEFQDNKDKPFDAEKYLKWEEAGLKAAQDNKKSVIAPKAAAFAVFCAAVLYGKARDDAQRAATPAAKKAAADEKAEAAKRLQDAADFTITTFPNNPEADEARLSLGKAKWSDGNIAEAITTFESINPKSEKYPEALRLAGGLRVGQFEAEIKKKPAEQDKNLIEKYRGEAIKSLTESLKEQIAILKPGDAIPPDLIKTQLLLAQVHMEVKDYAEAVKVLQPLVNAAYAAQGKTELDDTMLKIFSAAVRAYMAMDDYKKAGAAGGMLIDLGPDDAKVNVVLVDFVRRLDIELKELRDKLDKLADASPQETEALRSRISSIKDMMGKMVGKLADRKQLNAKSMIYLGTLFSDIDDFDDAEKQYSGLLARADSDADFKKEAAPSFLWVRGQVVDLKGKRGDLAGATEEIAKLRQEKPNNLDFMRVEAQLWQEWRKKTRRATTRPSGNGPKSAAACSDKRPRSRPTTTPSTMRPSACSCKPTNSH